MEHVKPWKLEGRVLGFLREPRVLGVTVSRAQGFQGDIGGLAKPGPAREGAWALRNHYRM